MHVDDDDRRLRAQLVDALAGDPKRVVDGRHEDPPHHVDDPDRDAAGVDDRRLPRPGDPGRVVGRPHDAVGFVQGAAKLAFVPDVVAGGQEVDPGLEQLVGRLLR